jgi:prepilin-type N-terminal cleavage/methylation domain-containing protein
MKRARGFSLLEMAVVLVIVGLLLGGLLGSVSGLQSRQRDASTERQLEQMRDALVTFAAVNGRLPCPADPATPATTAGAGLERPPTPAGCAGGTTGVLPWATLGLPQADAWGRRFTYRVTAAFARSLPAITLTSVGDGTVRNLAGVDIAVQVPAVILSHGANARRSFGTNGVLGAASADAGELENANGNAVFVSDVPTATFDDVVAWVPTSLLMGRMLQAGRLP